MATRKLLDMALQVRSTRLSHDLKMGDSRLKIQKEVLILRVVLRKRLIRSSESAHSRKINPKCECNEMNDFGLGSFQYLRADVSRNGDGSQESPEPAGIPDKPGLCCWPPCHATSVAIIAPTFLLCLPSLPKQKDTPGRAFAMVIDHHVQQPFHLHPASGNAPDDCSPRPPCPRRCRLVFGGGHVALPAHVPVALALEGRREPVIGSGGIR